MSLLLIDDNPVFCDTLARSLTQRGETVRVAYNRADALSTLNTHQPTRAILDLNLGGESGLQLLNDLLTQSPHLQVVVLTGYGSIATAVEAMKRGAVNYLCKPVNSRELLNAFDDTCTDSAQGVATPDTPLSVKRLEWEHIQRVLREHNGNISASARALKMHRRTLQRKLAKHPFKA